MLGAFLQIVMAIALVLIMFVIGFAINNMERLRALKDSGAIRKETIIYNGVKDLNTTESFDTLNPLAAGYKDLAPAINQRGGAEYSYSFWLYIDESGLINNTPSSSKADSDITADNPVVLLLRGDPYVTYYKGICESSSKKMKLDVLVKNPMIRLDNKGKVLTVEVNTFQRPDGVNPAASPNLCQVSSNDWLTVNTFRFGVKEIDTLFKKWFMVTVIVQDTYPTDPVPIRNKVRIQIYINTDLKVDSYMDGSLGSLNLGRNATILRTVSSKLHIAPVIKKPFSAATNPNFETQQDVSGKVDGTEKVLMSDLSYFNYAVDSAMIADRFNKGHSTEWATKTENPTTETSPLKIGTTGSGGINLQDTA